MMSSEKHFKKGVDKELNDMLH